MNVDMRKRLLRVIPMFFLVVALSMAGCGHDRRISFSGETMGTVYHITVVAPVLTSAARLQAKVDARLVEINNSMSTYISTSEINRFNAFAAGQPFAASADLINVLRIGSEIYTVTGGAWDATVWPLVRLWGFNRPETPDRFAQSTEARTGPRTPVR